MFSTSTVAQPERIASSATRRSSEVMPSRRVADDDGRVGALGRALGAELGVVVDAARDLAAAAQPCGVDQDDAARRPPRASVSTGSRVVPGALGDDHPLRAEQGVEQRRLADVGPARGSRSGRRLGGLSAGAVAERRHAARRSPGRAGRRSRARGSPRPSGARRGRASSARRRSPRPPAGRPCSRPPAPACRSGAEAPRARRRPARDRPGRRPRARSGRPRRSRSAPAPGPSAPARRSRRGRRRPCRSGRRRARSTRTAARGGPASRPARRP